MRMRAPPACLAMCHGLGDQTAPSTRRTNSPHAVTAVQRRRHIAIVAASLASDWYLHVALFVALCYFAFLHTPVLETPGEYRARRSAGRGRAKEALRPEAIRRALMYKPWQASKV